MTSNRNTSVQKLLCITSESYKNQPASIL